MPDLTLQHIDQIANDIGRENIIFSHLLHDLIDHVCCDVEYEMQSGLSFNEAYKRVKKKMGSQRRLKEIQEETLYAVDTKYRYMKNTMKISGIAGTIMFGFAVVFKIQHWPAAGIMLVLGALILALLFMPSALVVLWKETHSKKRLFLFASGFIMGFLFIFGTLFKIQHWPGAGIVLGLSFLSGILMFIPALLANRLSMQESKNKKVAYIIGAAGIAFYMTGMFLKVQHLPAASVFMILGLIVICAIAFPLYTRLTWKDEKNIIPEFLFIIVGVLLIVFPGALINLNMQYNYNSGYFLHQEQEQALNNTRLSLNKTILERHRDSLNYQTLLQLHTKTVGLLGFTSDVQRKMIEQADGKHETPVINNESVMQSALGPEIRYSNIANPFHSKTVKYFLQPGTDIRQDLDIRVAEYLHYLESLDSSGNISVLKPILDTEKFFQNALTGAPGISLMSGLHALEIMKSNIITAESHVLKSLMSQPKSNN
jgi:hypothetical protein